MVDPLDAPPTDDDPRDGEDVAHEHGVVLPQGEDALAGEDPGEALDVAALDGFVS